MDPTTARMMAEQAHASTAHLDSLAASLRASSDWFAFRHDLMTCAACAVVGLSFVLAAWVYRR